MTGLPGSKLHAAGRAVELSVDGHPDRTDLLSRRHQQRPHDQLVREEREVLAVELKRHAEDAVGDGVGQARRRDRASGRARPVSRAFMRTVSTGMTSSCSDGPPWWNARSPPALKTPLPTGNTKSRSEA